MSAPLPILIFEDEPIIACHLLDELSGMGYLILLTQDAAEALRLCEQHRPAVAILNFRGKNWSEGAALARSLQQRFLPMKILFVTGARRQDLLEMPESAALPVLFKPFSRRQLRSVLADLS